MPTIKKIHCLSAARPQKGVWFQYFDDIFISVVGENNVHHIRFNNSERIKKTDKKNNIWHLNWQYKIFEPIYGKAKTGQKTYEITVYNNHERHRIDTLINKTAIEFQHTLSVSVDEMNSRYIAQKSNGFTPYLVLDFTERLSFSDRIKKLHRNLLSYYENEQYFSCKHDSPELKKMLYRNFYNQIITDNLKWKKSDYYKNDNLFFDFKDIIIRMTKSSIHNFVVINKADFINNIENLDEFTEDLCKKEQSKIEEFIKKEKAKEKESIEKERERQFKISQENCKTKRESTNYLPYRICKRNPIISKIFPNLDSAPFDYKSFYKTDENGLYQKKHEYNCLSDFFNLQYTTYSKVNDQYIFLYAIVKISQLINGELVTYSFKISKKNTIILNRRIEIFPNYLHSFKHAALQVYNNNEPSLASYYIFNTLIEKKEDWESISHFYESRIPLNYEDIYSNRDTQLIKEIEKNDSLNLRQFIYTYGHIPSEITLRLLNNESIDDLTPWH